MTDGSMDRFMDEGVVLRKGDEGYDFLKGVMEHGEGMAQRNEDGTWTTTFVDRDSTWHDE